YRPGAYEGPVRGVHYPLRRLLSSPLRLACWTAFLSLTSREVPEGRATIAAKRARRSVRYFKTTLKCEQDRMSHRGWSREAKLSRKGCGEALPVQGSIGPRPFQFPPFTGSHPQQALVVRSNVMRGTDPLDFAVVRTHLRHAEGVYDVIRLANGYPTDRYCHCINPEAVAEQLERFPEGQFVAVTYEDGRERVVGMASTMLTSHTPDDEPLAWYDMIGSFGLRNHDPDGDWLYGVEIAVHPDYQRHGIGSALYRARL